MDWHSRYVHQASWTSELRRYLFQKAGLATARSVLEVGCGTGAILRDVISEDSRGSAGPSLVCAIDISEATLAECHVHAPGASLARADAHLLPYVEHAFDITFCHFLLLWLKEPRRALQEMRRVTKPHGHVLVLAEPDYSARVDAPAELTRFGTLQSQSLVRQGADVGIGAHVAELCQGVGINVIETGVIQPRGESTLTLEDQADEWAVLRTDLKGLVSRFELDAMQRLDADARQQGKRILYVPTYYVWGQV